MQPSNEGPGSSTRPPRSWLSPARVALVAVFSYGFLYLLQFQSPFIIGYDGYYHIKFAYLTRTLGFLDRFDWAALSIWAEHFSDKEMLYHFLLVPFTYFDSLATGIKLATVLIGTAVLASFYRILQLHQVRFPAVWFLLLCASGGHFFYRLCAPRPQVLSILLLLWSVYLLVNRRWWILAIVSFVYSWSYTGFHLPLLLSLIVVAAGWLVDREIAWKTPLAILAGNLLGMAINPYFPDNLRIFWLQNFLVPWMSLQGKIDIPMGAEFQPLDTRGLLTSHLALLVPYFVVLFLALVRPRPVDRRTRELFLISASLIAMTFVIQRFVEYSVPVTLLFLAGYLTIQLADVDPRRAWAAGGRQRSWVVAVAVLVTIFSAGLVWKSYRQSAMKLQDYASGLEQPALYLAQQTDEGELVFTCDWDDTPELFYFNHHNRYPVFLDPNFMYFQDRQRWEEWFKLARGRFGGRSYELLARDYRFGVCTFEFERLRWIIDNDPRMEVVLDNDYAYVFRIDREHPEIPLGEFLRLSEPPGDLGRTLDKIEGRW